MRHKYTILGLSVILIMLIVAKGYEPTQFPLQVKDFSVFSDKATRKLAKSFDKLIAFRTQQTIPDIPWDGFSIGDSIEYFDNNSKNTTDSTIIWNGTPIETRTLNFFSSDQLIEIDLYFRDESKVTSEILAMYGNNYLRTLETYDKTLKIYYSERYFWIKDSTIIIYEIDRAGYPDKGYLTVADISEFSEAELYHFIKYGRVSFYSIKEPLLQSSLERNRSPQHYTRPTPKEKKYGDSDVYQGSSKQKEDLEAIDRYFGL